MHFNVVCKLFLYSVLTWTIFVSQLGFAQSKNGSIEQRNRPFYSVFCTDQKKLTLDFYDKNPLDANGNKNEKANAVTLSCERLEKLDAQYTLAYAADSKAQPDKNGYIEVEYKDGNQNKKAWIHTKNLRRHDSLCDYAMDKLNGKKLAERVESVYSNLKESIFSIMSKSKEQEVIENLEKYLSSSPKICDGARNIGYAEPPIQSPSTQPKKCIYDNTRFFKTKLSGQCLAQKMNSLPRGSKESEEQYIKFFGPVALMLEKEHGIPAELFLSKLIFETGNGRDGIISSNNNIGGIGYNFGRPVVQEVVDMNGQKRMIKTGYAMEYFKFETIQDSIDYYVHMMVYQPETFGAYSGFRQTICATINSKLDEPNAKTSDATKAISAYQAADGLINYSHLRGQYVQTIKGAMGMNMIKNFKNDYILCDGVDKEAEAFYQKCTKGQMEPGPETQSSEKNIYTSEDINSGKKDL